MNGQFKKLESHSGKIHVGVTMFSSCAWQMNAAATGVHQTFANWNDQRETITSVNGYTKAKTSQYHGARMHVHTRRRAAVFLVATLPHVKHRGCHWQRHARQPRQKEHAREKKSELAVRCPQPHVHWRAPSQTLQGSDLVCNCIQNRACCKHETSSTSAP